MDKQRYLISYDIPDDRRRTKTAKFLDGFGDRLQYSVFEALLDRMLFDNLLNGLNNILNEREDKVMIIGLCRQCSAKRIRLGVGADRPLPGDETVFIV